MDIRQKILTKKESILSKRVIGFVLLTLFIMQFTAIASANSCGEFIARACNSDIDPTIQRIESSGQCDVCGGVDVLVGPTQFNRQNSVTCATISCKNADFFTEDNSDNFEKLVAITPGALSVSTGTLGYSVPIKMPPAAASLMPGLNLSYRNFRQNRQAPLVNAGHGWIVSGFTTVPECESGNFDDCERNRKERELFVKFETSNNSSSTTHTMITPNGYTYLFGENSNLQKGKSEQLTRVEGPYGNVATLHYRLDGQLSYIFFSTQESVIFKYEDEILSSITTIIETTEATPTSGQKVARYELSHKDSQTSDHKLLGQVKECGFDVVDNKACAMPIVFDYSAGQLGFGSQKTENWDGSDFLNNSRKLEIKTKSGKYFLRDMALYQGDSEQPVLTLFDHSAFIKAGARETNKCVRSETGTLCTCKRKDNGDCEEKLYNYPVVHTTVGDFNGDGLTDVFYGGAYWMQKDSDTVEFEWDGNDPEYDIRAGQIPPQTRPMAVPDRLENKDIIVSSTGKFTDINGDGLIDSQEDDFDVSFNTGADYNSSTREVVDYNKDGRTDAFFIKDGEYVVDFNIKQGNTYTLTGNPRRAFAPELTHMDDRAQRSRQERDRIPLIFIGDVTADGVPDALLAGYKEGFIAEGLRGQPDLLISVTDGFGSQTQIEYDTLHSDDVHGRPFYTPAEENLPWPNERASRAMHVVKTLKRSNGVGGFNTERFYYEGGWYNYHKRQFVGFEKISHIHVDNQLQTDTFYNLEMPFHGTIRRSETKTTDGLWVSRVNNHYNIHPSNDKFVYQKWSLGESFNLHNTPVSATKTINDYDAYGTLTHQEVITGSARSGNNVTAIQGRTITRNTPQHDTDNWLLGFIKSTTVTTFKGNEDDSFSATHSYVREPGTNDVKQTVVNEGTSLELVTTYTRDQSGGAQKGVVTQTTISAADETENPSAARNARLSGFEKGLYPTESYNAKDHKTEFGYDYRFGKVNFTRDPNGLESSIVYDPLGRDIEQVSPTGAVTTLESYFCEDSPYDCPGRAVYVSFSQTIHPQEPGKAAPLEVNFYDSLQRIIRTQTQTLNGEWIKQDTTYDSLGRLNKVSAPFKHSPRAFTYYREYDGLGVAREIQAPNGALITSSEFIQNGLLVQERNERVTSHNASTPTTHQITQTLTNTLGQVIEAIDAAGTSVHYSYNSRGQLVNTVVNNNDATKVTIEYDIAGNKAWIDDPAAGRIDYVYNGFGELRKQIWQQGTANEKAMRMDFDVLGRQKTRTDYEVSGSEKTHTWWYDNNGAIGLPWVVIGDSYKTMKVYTYDEYSRLVQLGNYFPGIEWSFFEYTYDHFGRPKSTTYPSGLQVETTYSNNGIANQVFDITAGANKSLWQLSGETDTRGNYVQQTLGNNVVIQQQYDANSGRLTQLMANKGQAATGTVGDLQGYNYRWSSNGNLERRTTAVLNANSHVRVDESFKYDNLNRLDEATIYNELTNTTNDRDYHYDAYGNLTNAGRGTIAYNQINGASLYGVTRAAARDYHYDAYGNVVKRGYATNEYNVFNKPTKLGNTQFWYNPDREKVKQKNGNKTTYFIAGGAYEVEDNNGVITTTSRVGDYVQKNVNGQIQHEYHLKDHLGSTDVITDQNGNEISRMAFDPFGKRLTEHVGSSALSQDAANDSSYHGYTGHSQLDHLGLVHMGGRVYDPDSGRFLSADLFVQSPYNTQSYNRYSYVFNNPLRNTDPSGYLSREDEAKKAPEEVLVLGHRISQQSNSLNMSLGFMSLFSSANSSFGGLPSGMISGFGVTSKMERYIGKLGVRARNGDIGAMQALQNIRKKQKALQKKLRTGGLNGEGLSLGVQKGNGYGVTDEQRQLVADGKIQEFWESRLAAGDPVARAGLASLNPEGGVVDYLFGGTSINNRLQAFANVYADGALNIDQVRVDLATAHINFTDGDRLGVRGLLNPGQIAEYHHQVFDRHGLPPTTFGGTPFTGAVGEAWATRPVWCGGCDWK